MDLDTDCLNYQEEAELNDPSMYLADLYLLKQHYARFDISCDLTQVQYHCYTFTYDQRILLTQPNIMQVQQPKIQQPANTAD